GGTMRRVHETKDGHRYTIEYDRNIEVVPFGSLTPRISPKGGKTTVTIIDIADNPIAVGEAFCAPYKREPAPNSNDNFNRSIGRSIALGRALKALPAGG